ncbi:MAG: nucleoside deaminase [Deltaproteobacteria bacterium]|nr:nucleoside deaminase [Deltaproteobacteria bacterium]
MCTLRVPGVRIPLSPPGATSLHPPERTLTDEEGMRLALGEARKASALDEVPVGAVLVRGDAVIGRGHNRRELDQDPTAHAEILALREAARGDASWRVLDATLYVTLEPCPMCAGALVNARVPRVVYGCDDPKAGALRTLYSIGTDGKLNHSFEVVAGVLTDECAAELRAFFARLRA